MFEHDLCFLWTFTLSFLPIMECETLVTCMFSDTPIKPTSKKQQLNIHTELISNLIVLIKDIKQI